MQEQAIEVSAPWLNESDFINGTFTGKVESTQVVVGKYGQDVRVVLLPTGKLTPVQMDMWGSNLYYLKNVLGAYPSKWTGKTITMALEGKKRVVVKAE